MNPQPKQYSRREALGVLSLLALTCHPLLSVAATKKRAMALQLYTLREPAKKDLADTLKKAREMGWEYVQWSGMPNLSAEKIRAALDTAGLKAIAAHVGMEPFEKEFETNVKFWQTVGVKDLAPGGMMNDCKASLKDWLNGARRLDDLGAKLRAAGLRLSYHNHTFEFEKFPDDNRRKLDILMEATKPENLKAELDLAWVYVAGVDPAAYIRKYKGRCPLVHAKDVVKAKDGKKQQFKPLGQGELNWEEIFAAGDEAGIEWYIYEQDSGEGSPFDFAQSSYDFLSKHMK
jgi:sugar phosphate isomerase/epimerase